MFMFFCILLGLQLLYWTELWEFYLIQFCRFVQYTPWDFFLVYPVGYTVFLMFYSKVFRESAFFLSFFLRQKFVFTPRLGLHDEALSINDRYKRSTSALAPRLIVCRRSFIVYGV